MEICHGAKVSRLTRSKSPLITDPRSKKKKTFPPSSFFHLLLPPPLCRATLRNSEKTLLKRVWAEITFPKKFAIARVNFAGIGRVSRKSAIIFNCSRVASRNENRGDVKIFDSRFVKEKKKKRRGKRIFVFENRAIPWNLRCSRAFITSRPSQFLNAIMQALRSRKFHELRDLLSIASSRSSSQISVGMDRKRERRERERGGGNFETGRFVLEILRDYRGIGNWTIEICMCRFSSAMFRD